MRVGTRIYFPQCVHHSFFAYIILALRLIRHNLTIFWNFQKFWKIRVMQIVGSSLKSFFVFVNGPFILANHKKKYTHTLNIPKIKDYVAFPLLLSDTLSDTVWCYWEQLEKQMRTWETHKEHHWESLGTWWEHTINTLGTWWKHQNPKEISKPTLDPPPILAI